MPQRLDLAKPIKPCPPVTRWIVLALTALSLAACTPRGEITLDPAAAQVGQIQQVYIGTTRRIDPSTGQFDAGRREGVTYARFDVSVPPDRKVGSIDFPEPGRPSDPRTQFLTTARTIYAGPAAFRAAVSRTLARQPRGAREAVVYVHGFNNTFAESTYRMAQIAHDLDIPGVAVSYAWPSAGNPLAYAHDRDSVLFARDGLETLLDQIARAGARKILLVGHSMGSGLVMEVLRQMRLDGNRAVMRRLSGVVLISPDLDIDVFRSEARRIGRLPQPFIIFTSDRDRVLALSARLTGLRHRLGNLQDVGQLSDLQVTLLNVSAFSSGVGHFVPANSPALVRILHRANELGRTYSGDPAARTGLLPGVVLTVRNATQVILLPGAAVPGR